MSSQLAGRQEGRLATACAVTPQLARVTKFAIIFCCCLFCAYTTNKLRTNAAKQTKQTKSQQPTTYLPGTDVHAGAPNVLLRWCMMLFCFECWCVCHWFMVWSRNAASDFKKSTHPCHKVNQLIKQMNKLSAHDVLAWLFCVTVAVFLHVCQSLTDSNLMNNWLNCITFVSATRAQPYSNLMNNWLNCMFDLEQVWCLLLLSINSCATDMPIINVVLSSGRPGLP
jgi:type IV secretory pathway TrbD component